MKKLLLFGAGKIGRSFIGQLFARSGYTLQFVDIDSRVVELLNRDRAYKVITRDNRYPEKEGEYWVTQVSALHLSEEDNIVNAIVEVDLVAISVGKRGLLGLAELIARGVCRRYKERKEQPLDLILAENIRNAAALFRGEMEKYAGGIPLGDYVGFVETSIGKMVPIMTDEQLSRDPLSVIAEPYNTLIIDALAFKSGIPDVEGLAPKMNMKAWVDRKIFIHNLGHAVLSYQANYLNPGLVYVWEALEIVEIRDLTRKTMCQSMEILRMLYPDEFQADELVDHIDNLLDRFSNKALGDTIYRIGCDLPRKLNRDDRLMIPILAGFRHAKEYALILDAWVKGCFFNATDSHGLTTPEDKDFLMKYAGNPLLVLSDHCKLPEDEYGAIYQEVRRFASYRAKCHKSVPHTRIDCL